MSQCPKNQIGTHYKILLQRMTCEPEFTGDGLQ
jgi:hypothetical protein